MATLWERIFRSRQQSEIARQLQDMRSTTENLAIYNNQLQSLLALNFRQQGGFTRFDNIQQVGFIRQGYMINADVYSIVSDIAQKGASIPLICYEVVDEGAKRALDSAMRQKQTDEQAYVTQKLRQKALRQVDYKNPIQKLIDRPNETDNPTTFYETSIGFQLLCGNNYWYSPRLDMGADKGKVQALQIMPSQFTGLVVTQMFPARVIGYELIINGVTLLQTEEVIHMRYPSYDYSVDGQQLYGMPPLKAGWNTLGLSNSGETSMTSMFNNGGPRVIVSNESITNDALGLEQMGRLKKFWNDEYSGNTNRNKVKLSAGKIHAIPIDMSPVDLNIIQGMIYSFDRLCNIFGVSSIMFNNHSASTESNVKEMIRDSWIRGVLPLRRMHCDAFNMNICPAYEEKGRKYCVEMDLSGVADLQPDKKTQAEWLAASWWISPNEKLRIQDMQANPDPNMDKIYIPSNLVALDDMNIDINNIPNAPEPDTDDDNADT